MNIISRSFDTAKNGCFISFNQDSSVLFWLIGLSSTAPNGSLAVSTTTGYRILSLNTIDTLVEIRENEMDDLCIVERLYSSSLLAIVSLSSPRKMKVCHFKKGTEICTFSYSNTILAVKLNRVRLIVCLEESLYIHSIRDMKVLHTIRDTPPNPNGLCALSTDDSCFLAYPGSSTIGEVQIFDTINLHCKMMIAAHDSPLAAMIFSPSGQLIATASEKGTVIRVFNVLDGTKLFEFRRGVKRRVNIHGLAFSPDSSFLAAASNTETVHVFKLDNPKDVDKMPVSSGSGDDSYQGWMGYLSMAVSASANYLPTQVTGVFSQGRAFAAAHLPHHGYKNICALTVIQKVLRLLVASTDGSLYIYNLDVVDGGDCNLIKQHKLLKKCEPLPEVPHGLHDEPRSSNRQSESKEQSDPGSISSYADILKGNPPGTMSDSEKFHEMIAATTKPDKDILKLDDDAEFPPVIVKSD